MKREKSTALVCAVCAVINLTLFFVKLYVSLSANSISIFSDAVNNLADCLSCVISAVCVAASIGLARRGMGYIGGRIEQLLSFVLSMVVAAVGLSFAYSSLERLMYPTPVWFSAKYFAAIALTAAVKLVMFLFLRVAQKKNSSPVLRVMRADSLMDFCVTGVTLVSFVMTKYTQFTVDAFAGIAISIFITVGAVRLIKSSVFALLGIVSRETFEKIRNKAAEKADDEIKDIFCLTYPDGSITAHITLSNNTYFSFREKEK